MYRFFLFTVRMLLRTLLRRAGGGSLLELTHGTSRPEVILIVQTLGPSESLLMTPLLRALKIHFPSTRLCLLGFAEQLQILNGNPYLDRVFVFKNTLVSYFKNFFRIRAQKIDLAIVCGTEVFAPLSIPFLLRPKWSISLSADPSCGLPFTMDIPINPLEDISPAYQKMVESIGVKIKDRRLFIVKKNKRHVNEKLDRADIASKGCLVGIGLGYEGPEELSKIAYSQLLEKLVQKKETAVLLFGPPGAQERMHAITKGMNHPAPVLVARLDEAFAILERLDCLFTEDPVLILAASTLKKNGIALENRNRITDLRACQSKDIILMHRQKIGNGEEALVQTIFTRCEELLGEKKRFSTHC